MAANSNGKYTAEQIEAQMRLSSLVDMNGNVIESVRPDVIDAANAKPIASSVQWQSGKASEWSSDAQKKIN
ncbi:hypothetical protein AU476_36330 [Cupriavidus sp. UYMSc13B]|nr:hypothetical protein AU476_36330 [Cupriavidus sp. UYMSc13B]